MGVQEVGAAMRDVMSEMVAPGATWAVVHGARHQISTGVAGPVRPDVIVRVASLTKPIIGVLTLRLAEQGLVGLDDPIERWLPGYARRRVLRHHGADLADTVDAARSTTIRDLLQMGVGWGFDAAAQPDDPLQREIGRREVGSGWLPPVVRPDRWVELTESLPMAHQPGEGWLYQYSFDALAVLLERATRRNLDLVLRDHVLAPLDMVDTGFTVALTKLDRVPANHLPNRGGRFVEASPRADPRLMAMPVFRSGATGLVSSADDLAKFARMLLTRGRGPRGPVISTESWSALTTDTLSDAARQMMQEFVEDPLLGWGLGVGIDLEARHPGSTAGRFGWDGGTGTTMWVDPGAEVAGVLLTRQGMGGEPPAAFGAFWSALHDGS